MENPTLAPASDELTVTDPSSGKQSATKRLTRRTWIVIAAAAVAVLGGAELAVATVHAAEHQGAVEAFQEAKALRASAYKAQDKAVEQLHRVEDLVTSTYPQYLSIGTTLTDSTVTDPALRTDLLAKTSELAAAALALDETGTLDVERPYLFTTLVPAEDVPLKGLAAPVRTEDVNALTDKLTKDASSVLEYVDLVERVTDDIVDAADAAAVSADVVMASAAEKGVTLSWEKAPAETEAVVAAATALTAEGSTELPLEERTALVSSYITAVNAAGTAHQAVLAQEAEAARQAAAEEAARQQQNHNAGSWNGSHSNSGDRGGWSAPRNNNGGSGPGTHRGSGPGNNTGGGTPPAQSNWQPLKLNVTGSTCSTTSGQEVSYGSTINVPGVNLDTYNTYEIPGYGWGASWKCKYW